MNSGVMLVSARLVLQTHEDGVAIWRTKPALLGSVPAASKGSQFLIRLCVLF
jgi:hypothetical protein